MKPNSTLFALLIGTFFCVGCGSDDTNKGSGDDDNGGSSAMSEGGSGGENDTNPLGSCDVDNGTHTCIDYLPGYTGSTPQGCAVLHGIYSETGSCSHVDNVGGCKQNVGKQTIWYYSPITEADVRVTCDNNPDATFVAP